jgi:purine-nucleoside phosphorylase
MQIALPDILSPYAGYPEVALVLGSGFGGLAESVAARAQVPYGEIPGFPQPAGRIPGHAGRLIIGEAGGVRVAVFSGRVHLYQGISALDAAYTARLAEALGAKVLIVTNAAGGLNPDLVPGEAVLMSDHINLMAANPLIGWPGPAGGTPFVPMTDAYDGGLRSIALEAAADAGLRLHEGVYAAVLGPSFETPAEVRYLRAIGADLVGMSTVPEVIAARALGLRVLGLSLVTNVAAGHGLDHEEVLDRAAKAQAELTQLLLGILSRLS